LFAASGLKAQTFPVPKFVIHVTGGYSLGLPDLKGTFPADLTKDPTPYFVNNGFNFGADAKYFVDKKSTFGIMLGLTYTALKSGNVAATDPVYGTGTFKSDLNIFTIGLGAEYDFAPKRPANPFVNVQFTTNIFSGDQSFARTDSANLSYDNTMASATRFGAKFGAGVDVKLSKSIGIIIGGSYNFANLFGKKTDLSTFGLNDAEFTTATTTMKARKIAYLQFFAGMSFYFGQPKKTVVKK
jgi:opacity protein-like surface antigen